MVSASSPSSYLTAVAAKKRLPLAQTRKKNDHEGGLTKIPKKSVKQEVEELGSDAITELSQKAVEPYRHNHKIMINGMYKRVSLLETDQPHLTQIWKPNLKPQITIPKTLAVETGLVDKKRTWLWDPQGRSWLVSVHLKKDGRVYMSGGWLDFCKGNNLEEGDAFVFEFLKEGTGDYAIHVHIFKAASEYL